MVCPLYSVSSATVCILICHLSVCSPDPPPLPPTSKKKQYVLLCIMHAHTRPKSLIIFSILVDNIKPKPALSMDCSNTYYTYLVLLYICIIEIIFINDFSANSRSCLYCQSRTVSIRLVPFSLNEILP